jgi:hypothetical protein
MNRIHLGRAIWFACTLACVAVLIFVLHDRQVKQKAAEMAAQQQKTEAAAAAKNEAEVKKQAEVKAELDAADARARFIAQYENTNFTRTPGIELIAVACAAEDGTMNHAISAALANRFKTPHVEFASSFFKPTLVTEGMFDEVFNGSGDMFKKLDLAKYLDGLVLAKQDVQYSKNDALDGVITADMHVQVVTLPVSGQIESQSWTLSAKGTGFNNSDARMQAEERIVKQITDDTNMTLN